MAITVTARGTYANSAGSTSTMTPGPSSTIAAGSAGIMVIGMDNAVSGGAGDTPPTCTDSAGNKWYAAARGVQANGANNGAECCIYWADIVTQVTSSDTVTVTFVSANVTAKTAAFWELAPAAGNRVLRITGAGKSTTGSSGAPTLTSSNVIGIGNVIVGGVAAESTDTFVADAGTTNGTWNTKQSTGTTGMSVCTQVKIQTTASSTQAYAPTLTSADWAEAVATFVEAPLRVRHVGSSNTTGTTQTIWPDIAIAAGSLAVLCVACDNANGTGDVVNYGATPVTDTVSNTWTTRQNNLFDNGAAAAGSEVAIFTGDVTTLLPAASDWVSPTTTLTLTFAITTINKSWVLMEFAPSAGGNTWSFALAGGGGGATGTAPTVNTSSIPSGDTVVAVGAAEDSDQWTADADTSNGSWSSGVHSGFGAAGHSIIVQTKTVTGTAAQTFNPTLAASVDAVLGWISLHETVAGFTATQRAGFFQFFP